MHDKHTIYHRGIDKHIPTNARTHNSQSNALTQKDLHQEHNHHRGIDKHNRQKQENIIPIHPSMRAGQYPQNFRHSHIHNTYHILMEYYSLSDLAKWHTLEISFFE